MTGRYPWYFPVVTDGKPPLSMILFAAASRTGSDPVLAARLVSVGVSVITLAVMLWIFRRLYGTGGRGWFAALLIVCPYLLLFDRMALAESTVTALYALSIALFLKLRESYRIPWALVLGAVLGVGWWVKTSVFVAMPVIGVIIAYDILRRRALRKRIAVAVVSAAALLILIVAPLRFNDAYRYVTRGETKWIFSLPEMFAFPVVIWLRNTAYMGSWFAAYLTPPVFLASLAGIVAAFRRRSGRIAILAVFIPVVGELLAAKSFTARYPVMVVPWVILLAYAGIRSLPKLYRAPLFGLLLAVSIAASAVQSVSPLAYYRMLSPLPYAALDYRQYIAGFTSGYGIGNAVEWLRNERGSKPTIVFVRQDSGNPEDAMYVYLERMPNFRVGYLNNTYDYGEYRKATSGFPKDMFYFVSRGGAMPSGMQPYLTERARYGKPLPGDVEYVGVYSVRW